MPESINYSEIKINKESVVHVLQEIAGTRDGRPRINIMGATGYGKIKFLLDERAQMIFSPGPLILKLKRLLKDFKQKDYLLLTGDPALIGVACCIVSDLTNGKFNLLKWDKQERRYYPIEIDIYNKGETDEQNRF